MVLFLIVTLYKSKCKNNILLHSKDSKVLISEVKHVKYYNSCLYAYDNITKFQKIFDNGVKNSFF